MLPTSSPNIQHKITALLPGSTPLLIQQKTRLVTIINKGLEVQISHKQHVLRQHACGNAMSVCMNSNICNKQWCEKLGKDVIDFVSVLK